MADKEVRVGDKFIIEVDEVEWHPTKGNRYYYLYAVLCSRFEYPKQKQVIDRKIHNRRYAADNGVSEKFKD